MVKKARAWGDYDPKTNSIYYPLHSYQQKVLKSKARFTFAFAGTGGGKTCLLPLWLLRQVEKNPKGRFLIVVPTYGTFEQSRFQELFLQVFEPYGKYISSKHKFELASGGVIFIRSAEYPESIEGGQYHAACIDEAAKVNHRAWTFIKARVGQLQAPILGVTTPDANSWIYQDIYKRWKSGDEDYQVIQWSSVDNPSYSTEAFEQAKATMSEGLFRRRYLGEFARLDGLVYETFSEQVIETPDVLPSPAIRIAGGIDWGWSDPCAVTLAAECQDGRIYIIEEVYESKLPLDALADKLKQLEAKWSIKGEYGVPFVGWFCDHSRPEIMNQIKRQGISAKSKKVRSIETGISMVDARLRTDNLRIFDCCENLIEEANHYQRQTDKDGDELEKAIDKHNHCMDSIRYLISGLDYGRNLKLTKQVDKEDVANEEAETAKRLGFVKDIEEIKQENELKKQKEQEYLRAFGDLMYENCAEARHWKHQ